MIFPHLQGDVSKVAREATYFSGVWTIQFPRQIARCAMGISWGFLVALWFTSSRGKAMDNWCYVIWDFPGLRLPEAYVRLLSCSHQPDMKRWKDRKVKERTSMDSKQQLLTQLLLTQFFGGWTIESWKKPWLALAPGITRLVAVISRIRALEAAHCDRKMACIYIYYNIIYIC